jgi:hypothetical protein
MEVVDHVLEICFSSMKLFFTHQSMEEMAMDKNYA